MKKKRKVKVVNCFRCVPEVFQKSKLNGSKDVGIL